MSATFMFNAAQRLIVGRAAGPSAAASGMDLETLSSGNVVTNTADRLRVLLLQNQLSSFVHAGATNMGGGSTAGGLFNLALYPTVLEYAGGGYTTGGSGAVGAVKSTSWNQGVALQAGNAFLFGDDINWGALTATTVPINAAILYYGDGNLTGAHAATDIPIACFRFDAAADGSTLILQWASQDGVSVPANQGIIIQTVGVV